MWLSHVCRRHGVRRPEELALRDARRDLTWWELEREVADIAAFLAGRVCTGGRVAVLSGSRVEVLETYLACAAAGVVVVPIDPSFTDHEIGYVVESVEPTLTLADAAARDRLRRSQPDLEVAPIEFLSELPLAGRPLPVGGPLEAPFAILFTSRTAGRPNGVVVDQRSVKQGAVAWLADVGPAPGTAFLNACPLLHGSVLIALSYLAAGATVCVLDAFSAAGCLAALQRWKVEHTFLVPAMVATLLASAELRSADLDALRLVLHGAPPMPPALAGAATEALGADLQTIFGVTEAGGPVVSLGPRDRPLAAPVRGGVCVGRPMLGVDLRVVGPDGTPLGAGEVGRLHLSGDGLMRGYWKNPEATAEVLHDGWLDTRDLACVGLDGYVWCWTGPVT